MTDNTKLISEAKAHQKKLVVYGTPEFLQDWHAGVELIDKLIAALHQSTLDIKALRDENEVMRGQVSYLKKENMELSSSLEAYQVTAKIDKQLITNLVKAKFPPQPLHAEEVKP